MADVVYDAILGTNTLAQVTNSSFDENLEVLTGRMSGATNPSDHFIQKGSPKAELSTVDIGGFLTAFGTVGNRIATGTGVIIPWNKRASGGTFAGGSSNPRVIGNTGSAVQLLPRSINAPRSGVPTAQGEVIFLSPDGIVIPHLVTLNNALASQAFNAMYGLGPVYLNLGAGLAQIPTQIGFNVNFGVGLSELEHFAGAVWPTDCFIETADPSIEVMFEDFDQIASYTGGVPITGLTAYLQKRASGGTYVSSTTAGHIKFTVSKSVSGDPSAGILVPKAMSAAETKHGNASFHVAGNLLAVTVGTTIP